MAEMPACGHLSWVSRVVPMSIVLALAAGGCGARTDGLVSDRNEPPFDPFADASWDESGTIADARPRDTGSFPDEGFAIDSGAGRDGGVGFDAAPFDSGPPSSPGCPIGLPADGTSCGTSKLTCFYGGCDPKAPDR